MKSTIITIILASFVLLAAGCVTRGEEGPEDTQSAENIIPFGLKLKYNVEKIYTDDPKWRDIKYDDHRFPKNGITVNAVLSGRQAEIKGFEAGDIIYAVNEETFESTSEFVRILYDLEPGHAITFHVIRKEDNGLELRQILMVIPTYGYVDYDFPVLYGHHNNDYIKRTHVFYWLYHNKRIFGAQTSGMFPFYHKERIGNVCTRRILWFFKWRTGTEDELII